MTVAPSRILAGAASTSLARSSCANALTETAASAKTNKAKRFMRKPPFTSHSNFESLGIKYTSRELFFVRDVKFPCQREIVEFGCGDYSVCCRRQCVG